MGKIFGAGEETQERTPLLCDVVADSAAEHWVAGFEGLQDGTLGGRTLYVELHFAADAR